MDTSLKTSKIPNSTNEQHSIDMLHQTFLDMNLIGISPEFKRMLEIVRKVSQYDVGVNIYGETGTGKELIARTIHYLSERKNKAFIPVNCGAFTDDLFLNEFFGHKKGAYTGANDSYDGLVKESNGGTLFLDEIDSLSTKSQAALLRFLEKYEFKSLGCSKLQKVNIRILCACNKDLKQLCSKGLFREDLLYRLDILKVEIPPLRHRSGDISLLADYFMKKVISRFSLNPKVLHPDTLRVLEAYQWPGNVRELENYMYKLILLYDGDVVKIDKLNVVPDIVANSCNVENSIKYGTFKEEKIKMINLFEKNYLQHVMIKMNGNISKAARYAKKERRSFTRLLEKHGLNKLSFL